MSEPNITVFPVTSQEDFSHLVKVEEQAYGSSKMLSLLFSPSPSISSDQSHSDLITNLRLERHVKSWKDDPSSVYLKAVTSKGEIIGMATWNFYTDASISRDPWRGMKVPEGGNQELGNHYFGTLVRAREEVYGESRSYVLLANLVVAPNWQRMGVGKVLLEWGLQEVDELGLECWLDASPYGLGLYKRYGWKEVKVLDFDLSRWGGEDGDVHRTVCMIRGIGSVID